MKAHPQKKRIMVALEQLFEMANPGDQIKSEDIVNIVKRKLEIKYIYPDTVLRYLRELRQDGILNYRCISKSKRIFEVI